MTPEPPTLEFVFEIRADIAPALQAGPGKLGERRHIPITGGTVAGPRLNGRILPGGSDWALARRDGASIVDAHYTVQADDGTPIYVHNRGLRVAEPAVLERLRRGAAVAPHEVYFRTSPVFDAPEGPHAWLCDRIFVADAGRVGVQVHIRVFMVR
jgi:hypothetical protein